MNVTDHPLSDSLPISERLTALTTKQREVLDLLVQFKTSKEISRILAISHHTVDQRIDAAKVKLGAASRAELALIYRELVDDGADLYERLTYESSPMAREPATPHGSAEPEEMTPIAGLMLQAVGVGASVGSERDYRVGPALFDGRWGTPARLMTILTIAIMLCIAFLGGLTMMVELSSLMRR